MSLSYVCMNEKNNNNKRRIGNSDNNISATIKMKPAVKKK